MTNCVDEVEENDFSCVLKAFGLPRASRMHVSGHVPLYGRAWARLAVTIDGGSIPGLVKRQPSK